MKRIGILGGWVLLTLSMMLAGYVVPGVRYEGLLSLLAASLVLGMLNTLLRPLLCLLSIPFILITLGLFLVVINALLIMLTGALVPGFDVAGFWPAVGCALIISLVNLLIKGRLTASVATPVTTVTGPAKTTPLPSTPAQRGEVIDI